VSTTSKVAGVGIAGLIVGALVTAGVAMAVNDDDDMMNDGGDGSVMGMTDSNDHFGGMMGSMGAMDYDQMLDHMRQVLGEDAYAQMLNHMNNNHRSMTMTGDMSIDGMMHYMMDGMTGRMHSNGAVNATPTPR